MMPGYRLRKRLKRVGLVGAVGAKDGNGQVADVNGNATLYIDPNSPHTNDEAFTRWLVMEHVKAVADPDEVETINIVFSNPLTQ